MKPLITSGFFYVDIMRYRFSFHAIIFLLSFCIYGAIGFLFAYNTKLVYNPDYICDLSYGFDNAYLATSFVRHPLLKVFSLLLNFLFGSYDSTTISFLLVSICSVLLSVQNLFLFKIFDQILLFSRKKALLFTSVFSVFGGNLLLSFTFDSYVFSGCFMMMFLFYFLKAEKEKERMSLSRLFLFSMIIGGITVTNYIKVALISLFSVFRRSYYKIILLAFSSLMILYLTFYNQVKASLLFISQHTNVKGLFFRNVTDYFLASPFLIPKAKISQIDYIDGTKMYAVVGEYFSFPELLVLVVLGIAIFLIICVNIKKKIVQILLLCFLVDIFIHVIWGLGISEAYIFFGNFSFILPIIIGIGYQSIDDEFYRKVYVIGLLIMSGVCLFLNIRTLTTLYNFGLNYY
ncbi:DUF6080 domain-containing protein [Chryseobacterium sp. T1]